MKTLFAFIALYAGLLMNNVMAGQGDTSTHQHDADPMETSSTRIDAAAIKPNEVMMEVHGIVCSFCSQGVKKKLAKFTFIDRARYNKGILMNVEKQRITVAIKAGETADIQGMFAAVVAGGYAPVSALIADDTGSTTTLKPDL